MIVTQIHKYDEHRIKYYRSNDCCNNAADFENMLALKELTGKLSGQREKADLLALPFQSNCSYRLTYSIHLVNMLNRIYSHKVLIKQECIRGKYSYLTSDYSFSVQQD